MIYARDGRELAGHEGATAGFSAFVGYDPKDRIGVVVLSNASAPTGVGDIGLHLLDPKVPLANSEPPATTPKFISILNCSITTPAAIA